MERLVLACGLRVLSFMAGTLWWEHLPAVVAGACDGWLLSRQIRKQKDAC